MEKPYNLSRIQTLCLSGGLEDFIQRNSLKIDFSGFNCDCGSSFQLVADSSSYPSEKFCWKCSDRKCRRKFSPKSGSWFDYSKLSYEQALKVTYCWVRKYSNDQCAFECDVSDKSVIDWYNFC